MGGYDVKRLIIRFSVWLEESVRQVDCNIEVVKLFEVTLNCYFRSVFLEAPCYFFPCPFCLRSCGVLKNGESVVPVESNVVCSVFVCKVVQDRKFN